MSARSHSLPRGALSGPVPNRRAPWGTRARQSPHAADAALRGEAIAHRLWALKRRELSLQCVKDATVNAYEMHQDFLSSSGVCCEPKLGKENVENKPRV